MERDEYLQRPLIEGVEYQISDQAVRIGCDHTCFILVEKETEKIPLQQVEQLFGELKQAARRSGKIKLKGVTKFLPAVRTLYPGYCAANEKMHENFSQIAQIARKLQTDGIHKGCNDDELLQTAICRQNEIGRLHYRNSDYSRFRHHYQTLLQLLQDKPWEEDGISSYTIPLV